MIAAGGVFTGGDAAAMLRGASGCRSRPDYTVTKECACRIVKQRYFAAEKEDVNRQFELPHRLSFGCSLTAPACIPT